VMVRSVVFGFMGASIAALTPLVARDQLHGDAATYGLLLGATGIGAVIGALMVSDLRERVSPEAAVRGAIVIVGLMILIVGLSHNLVLTAVAMAIAGAANMMTVSMLNVAIQLSVPRWVAARSLAWYQSALTGGGACGAWFWGQMTTGHGLSTTFLISGACVLVTPLIGLWLPLPGSAEVDVDIVELTNVPQVVLGITHRSGPIVIEIDYDVDPADARSFYDAMLQVQSVRLRNGAFEWSIARDIADEAAWTERFHFPTWQDYLRQRTRFTQSDRALQSAADAFNRLEGGQRVRRLLERPLGSVRWQADTPDPRSDPALGIYAP
jgi:hypothetical protein